MGKYKTLSGASEGLYKEKGSKFLAFAFPVSSEKEIQVILRDLRKQYHDARHHCYAYLLGLNDQIWRINDDGEPSHAAGDPILGQIRAFELTNILIVVVRYFGGIKLGVGGLVTAYKSAARSALENARIIILHATHHFSVSFPYALTSEMESLFNDFNLEFDDKNYSEKCEFKGRVRQDESGLFEARLSSVYGIEYSIN